MINTLIRLPLFRVPVDFIEYIGIRQKRAQAGFGAEVDHPAAVLDARKVRWVRFAKDPPAEGDEAWLFLRLGRLRRHTLLLWSNFRNENFIRIDRQSVRWLGNL
jgi:hypothetical protein